MNPQKPTASQSERPISPTISPDAVAMSSMGAAQQPDVPMSFDSAGALLRQRVLDPPAHPGILANLDHYSVDRVLGMGGMGIVLQARHPVTDAQVAIKLVRPEFVNEPNAVHRFLIEARHMHNLSHPNIVRVMEVSDRPRGPYYVMPFYPLSLAQKISPGVPLKRETIIEIGRQIAEAVAYAHGHGVIHRDLKPGNVLLDREGHAYVSDFGLVRTVFNDSIVDVNQSHCEGTASYMSPAVAAGEAEDTRCDIYALGAMLYEMLTGCPPYSGPTQLVLEKVLKGPPTPIRDLNAKADARLVKIAEGAMARALRDRYAAAADIAADLKRVEQGLEPFGPYGSPRGKNTVLWTGIAGVVAVVIVGMVLLNPNPHRGASTPFPPAAAPPTASGVPISPPSVPLPIPAAPLAITPPPPVQPPISVAPVSNALVQFDHLKENELTRYLGHSNVLCGVKFTPDQLHFVSTAADRTATLVEIATGKIIWTYRVQGFDPAIAAPSFSPDGKSVLLPEYIGDAVLLDLATGAVRMRFIGHRTAVCCCCFSPDGKFAVTGSGHWESNRPPDYTVRAWDIATGKEVRRFGEGVFKQRATQVQVSPDGKLLLTGSADNLVRLWDFNTGALLSELSGHTDRTVTAAFNADASQIISADWLGNVRMWDTATRKCILNYNTSNSRVEFVRLSPTGDRFAEGDIQGAITIFDTPTGRILARFDAEQHVDDGDWSADGARFLTGGSDRTVRLWSVPR